MKKTITIMITLLFVLGMLAACAPAPSPEQPAATAEAPKVETPKSEEPTQEAPAKKFKIGINHYGQANFFARIGKATMEEVIPALGGEFVATVTPDVNSRTAAIENMVQQGVDAIIIQEGDMGEIAPALEEAKRQGIIIASMGAGDLPDVVDVYVSSDEYLMGKTVAEEMVRAMGGKGNVVEIYNDLAEFIRQRKEAMHDVVAPYSDIEVKFGFVYAWPDFFPDVKGKMEALIQANPKPGDIAAVYSTFDGGACAAASAIREAGLQDSIVVVGIDGDPDAYEEMRLPDSPMVATLAQDPATIAKVCVESVFKLLNGETLPERHIMIPGVLITKDNIPAE